MDTAAPSFVTRFKRGKSRKARPITARRIVVWIIKAMLIFVGFTLLQVCVCRFVPVPVTFTMLGDANGFTKDWTSLDRIDPDMARAAIAGEDSRFCLHNGFDFKAIQNAYQRNARGGRIRGGSTISQQTAKNVFLWQGGGYVRKGLEAWYTVLIETIWGKRRIMEVYLNVAETGIGTYGAEAGAQRYFRHGAGTLSRTEAARIAAVLPLPKKREAVDPGGSIWDAIGPERAIGCVVYIAAEIDVPGQVRHVEYDRLPLGEPSGEKTERVSALAGLLVSAGIRSAVRTDIRNDIWVKLWGNLCFNPLSALTRATLDVVATDPGSRALAKAMMTEAEAIARALGADFRVDVERRINGAARVGAHRTSMLQDLERGRPLEIDALLTAVQEMGRMTGVATPYIDSVLALVQQLGRSQGLYPVFPEQPAAAAA